MEKLNFGKDGLKCVFISYRSKTNAFYFRENIRGFIRVSRIFGLTKKFIWYDL